MSRSDEEKDDLPDDFFDDFTKTDFLEGLDVIDEVNENEESPRKRKYSTDSDAASQMDIMEQQSNVLLEIKRLERDIAERRKKLRRSPAKARSPRKRSRTRSRGRRDRRRSRPKSRGRDDKSRYQRNRSPFYKNRRRSRSGRREGSSTKCISFLEELAAKFAERGEPFPEAEGFDPSVVNKHMSKYNESTQAGKYPPQGFGNHYNQMPGNTTDYNNAFVGYDPTGMNDYYPPQPIFQQPHQIAPTISPPPPSLVRDEPIGAMRVAERHKKESEEMIKKTTKERILSKCFDAVNALKFIEEQPVFTRFIYASTIIPVPSNEANVEYNSPLRSKHNISFEFSKIEHKPSNLIKRFNPSISKIINALGYNVKKLNESDLLAETRSVSAKVVDDALPLDLKQDNSTQTNAAYCERCIQNDLKSFKSTSTQAAAVTYNMACQTSNEDMIHSLSEMTPAQLIAINDFSKILKGGLTPANYREATDLRDRLFNIYQTCTGVSRSQYIREQEQILEAPIRHEMQERPTRHEMQERPTRHEMQERPTRQVASVPQSLNEDFARRSVANVNIPQSSNGMLTSKQIMELERGSATNNRDSFPNSSSQTNFGATFNATNTYNNRSFEAAQSNRSNEFTSSRLSDDFGLNRSHDLGLNRSTDISFSRNNDSITNVSRINDHRTIEIPRGMDFDYTRNSDSNPNRSNDAFHNTSMDISVNRTNTNISSSRISDKIPSLLDSSLIQAIDRVNRSNEATAQRGGGGGRKQFQQRFKKRF